MSEQPSSPFLRANNPTVDQEQLERRLDRLLASEQDLVDPVDFQVTDIYREIRESPGGGFKYQAETDPECFVEKVYHAYLGRQPDPMANKVWLKRLLRGWPRALLPLRIRFSPEGRQKKLRLRGSRIWIAMDIVGAIPLFGRLVQIGRILWLLPAWYRENENMGSRLRYLEEVYEQSRLLLNTVNTNVLELEQAICSLESEQRLECALKCREIRHRLLVLAKAISRLSGHAADGNS